MKEEYRRAAVGVIAAGCIVAGCCNASMAKGAGRIRGECLSSSKRGGAAFFPGGLRRNIHPCHGRVRSSFSSTSIRAEARRRRRVSSMSVEVEEGRRATSTASSLLKSGGSKNKTAKEIITATATTDPPPIVAKTYSRTIASSPFGSPTRIVDLFNKKRNNKSIAEEGDDDDEDEPVVDNDAWKLLALSFLCMIICSLDRVAMSVAILPMSLEFGFTETTKGAISSIFSLGYMTSMLPAGVLATIYSPKAVLATGVAIWSVAQILSPTAAHSSLEALLLCRFAMGAAEAVATPTVQSLVGNWFPSSLRSRVVSLLASGLNLGVLSAYLASPALIQALSWEDIFHVYGGLGLFWLALWLPIAKDRPSTFTTSSSSSSSSSTTATSSISKLSVSTPSSATAAKKPLAGLSKIYTSLSSVPWGSFVRSKELWGVTFAHMSHNYGLYVLLAWLPTYFSQTYGLDLSHSSTLSVTPWIAAAIVSNVAGWSADALINSEVMSKTMVRKLFQCTALLVPAACMAALASGPHTPSEAQVIFTLSVAAGSMSSAGFATATQDLASKYIGITYGATSALSVIVGSLGTFGTGVILDQTHEWTLVFGLASGVYVAGALAFASLFNAKKIFD